MPRTQKGHNRIGNEASVTHRTAACTCALCPTFHPEALPTVTAIHGFGCFSLAPSIDATGTFPRSIIVLGFRRPLALRIVLMQKVESIFRKPSGCGICTAKMRCADYQM